MQTFDSAGILSSKGVELPVLVILAGTAQKRMGSAWFLMQILSNLLEKK
jgi:hypothetical protein